ncbi:MAG: hypothetical protein HUJ76_05785, partial [Parasporobacterium sp.]|nr:hypothetical protein [Parasporobacterium sp.]
MEKLLVCSCVAYDPYSNGMAYLLDNYADTVKKGVEKYAEMRGASDIIYLLPEGSKSYGLGKEAFSMTLPALDNPFAVAQVLVGNLPRPMIADDYVAVYEGKEVLVLTPDAAYVIATGTMDQFVTVNKGGVSEVKKAAYNSKLGALVDLSDAKAVLVGGLKGRFVTPAEAAEIPVTGETPSVTVYGKEACMVCELAKIQAQTWQNSCGKCVLCREGTLQCKAMVEDMP